MTAPADRKFLHGKRILLVEGDDRLYLALSTTLRDAGCQIAGLLAHFSDAAPVTVPSQHIDAAVIDVGWTGVSFASIAEQLDGRSVPILYIGVEELGGLPASSRLFKQLRKPFTERELLDGLFEAINGCSPADSLESSVTFIPEYSQ